MEMKIRESCLQIGTFIYKPGISVTKQDFHLQMGILGLQMGFSGYYLPLLKTLVLRIVNLRLINKPITVSVGEIVSTDIKYLPVVLCLMCVKLNHRYHI